MNQDVDEFILWGAGEHAEKMLSRRNVPLRRIEAVIDINPQRQGKKFYGIEISKPDIIYSLKSDLIVIGTDKYLEEVKCQIIEMGLNKNVVFIDEFVNVFSLMDEVTSCQWIMQREIDKLVKLTKEYGNIPENSLKNAIVLADRKAAIKRMPKGMIVAEVGVAYGDFSRYILDEMRPNHFYAIDFFNKDNPYISFWGRHDFEETGLTHEEWYCNRFREEINSGVMSVCSGLSWDCLSEFEDDFFDYVYLDACHDYESTSKDVNVIVKKVKSGGIIQFNDYTLCDILGQTYFGVVPVVNQLICQTNSEVLFYCLNALGYCDVVVRLNK